MMEWQTIDSAPKDGTEIILFVPGVFRKGHRVQIGRYVHSVHTSNGEVISDSSLWSYGSVLTMIGTDEKDREPTHWMALPSEPDVASDIEAAA